MLFILRMLLLLDLFYLLIIIAWNFSGFTNRHYFIATSLSFSNKFISLSTCSVNSTVICKVRQICLLHRQEKVIYKNINRIWSTFRCFDIPNKNQAWILAPNIGQCLAKNWFMSDEDCLPTDTVVLHKVKTKITDVLKLRSIR